MSSEVSGSEPKTYVSLATGSTEILPENYLGACRDVNEFEKLHRIGGPTFLDR